MLVLDVEEQSVVLVDFTTSIPQISYSVTLPEAARVSLAAASGKKGAGKGAPGGTLPPTDTPLPTETFTPPPEEVHGTLDGTGGMKDRVMKVEFADKKYGLGIFTLFYHEKCLGQFQREGGHGAHRDWRIFVV